jgi:broad specificity phosphatase PhoE
MRLLLIRHGRSAHVHPGGLLDRDGVERWRAAYDEAGIASDDRPPAGLASEVARASVIAASDLPRAVASAARLAQGRELSVSPLFREVVLPLPAWSRLRAPLLGWETLVHLDWGIGLLRGAVTSPEILERAGEAAAWCRDACRRSDAGATVAVVTHGVFRHLLARQLRAEGWRIVTGPRGWAPWSAWRLSADPRLHASSTSGRPGGRDG